MSKLDKVNHIISHMIEFDKLKQYVFIRLHLLSPVIHEFVDKFIINDNPSKEELDAIRVIIIMSKTIYEHDRYTDPFDDEVYDKMLAKYKKYRDEPFGNNATGLANANYKYEVLAGTLDKVHFIYEDDKNEYDTRNSLEEFIESIPVGKHDIFDVIANHKEDGTSVTIDFKLSNGGYYVGVSAIGRGKKDYGEGTDVSSIIPTKSFEGHKLQNVLGFMPRNIGIQFELLVSDRQKKEFEKYAHQSFANNRSAASGLLRRIVFANKKECDILRNFASLVPVGFDILDSDVEDDEYYDISWDIIYKAVCEIFTYGDISMEYKLLRGTKEDILKKFKHIAIEWLSSRDSLNHAIDGVVMTLTSRKLQRKLGRKNSINKYQIAYKFPEEKHKTVVRGIEITTGNFGYKEMLLLVDPVILNGTKQKKAQVHSLDRFNDLDLRYGDEIILKLSGDVIPYGYKDSSCKRGDGEKIKFPTHCECGEKLIIRNNKLRCSNPECPHIVIGSFVTFFTSLNAKGIGYKTCEQLYYELGIRKPSQILKLTKDDFMRLKGFKEKSSCQCMETIKDILTKPRNKSDIIGSVGIDLLRSSTAEKILNVINSEKLMLMLIENKRSELIERLKKADGIDTNAEPIVDGLLSNKNELITLLSIIPSKESVKYDKNILISGMRNDEELTEIANRAGYGVKDSGTKYDILVIKDYDSLKGSKAKRAKEMNKPIMTRNEFIAWLNN